MTLILVEHDAAEPALYDMLAAAVARRTGAGFAHLPVRFDTARLPDAVQHVTADGALVPSGLVAVERLTEALLMAETTPQALVAAAASTDVVVPLHPPLQGRLGADLRALLAVKAVPVRDLRVVTEAGRFRLVDRASGAADPALGTWVRDRYGRLTDQLAPSEGRTIQIGLLGTERDHRDVYPAGMAALGDAADALGVVAAVSFIDPPSLDVARLPDILQTLDGIVLPGGADMINVPVQIETAHAVLRSGTPTLGLCLGMQSMATAVAQQALDRQRVGMAEANPDAPVKSFTPMAADASLPSHRLGDQPISVEAASRLALWMRSGCAVRYNHRFHFNAALLTRVGSAGLRVSAWDRTGRIVDAVEHAAHPFYVGLQGHPELSSRPGSPHPVMTAFLQAALSIG